MRNCQTRCEKRRMRYCFFLVIAFFAIWFAKCDDETKTDMLRQLLTGTISSDQKPNIQQEGKQHEEASCFLEDCLQEYCLAGAFVSCASEQETDIAETDIRKDLSKNVMREKREATASVAAMAGCRSYMQEKLADYDYIKNHFYVIDSTTNVSREELNGQDLASMDLTIDTEDKNYKVLIYHTHGTESFKDSEPGKVEDTVIGVGDYLTQLLEENYGVAVYHDTTAYDMTGGELDRSAAYDYAREGVQKILTEYPSIDVVIDIHRDGVAEDTYLITEIGGKKTAQIMFLNGVSRLNKNGDISYLANPYKTENLAFSLQMYLTAQANYGSFVRKIFVKGYRYNLDLKPRSLLVEVGSQTNTVEEAKNAMEPLSAILYKVLSGK